MNLQFLIFAILMILIGMSKAVTIHWGSAVGDFLYESDGVTLVDPSEYTFALGTFADGFTPDETNMTDWEANWHTLDVGGYSSTTGRYAGSVTLLNTPDADGTILDGNASGGDTAATFFGKDAFVWIYNQNTTVDSSIEWTLLSNPTGGGDPNSAWTFPSAAASGAHTEVVEMNLSDDGVTASFGEETGGSSTTTGDGQFSQTPTNPYGIQTYTIPEPSSTALLLAGLGLLIGRRQRSARKG